VSVLAELAELTGLGVTALLVGALASVTVLPAALTWPMCALLLALYRRSVRAGMRRGAAPARRHGGQATTAPARPRIEVTPVTVAQEPSLLRRARRRARRGQLVFAAAGLSYGLASTVVLTVVEDLSWRPVRTLTLTLVFGCLVVPSVIAQGVTSRRSQVALYAGYGGLLLGLPVLIGASLAESLLLLAVLVALPGLIVLAIGLPAVRGAAWLVAPALALAASTGLLLLPVVWSLWSGVALTPLLWALLASAVCLLAAGVAYGWAMTALHSRKWINDQTLLVLQWWAVLTLAQVLLRATQGAWAATLTLCPFAVLVTVLVLATGPRREQGRPPVRLLLLRTFGARRRSSQLLRGVTSQWRWIGSVELITATDVATEVLEPHEFLDFLRRRLPVHFVTDPRQVPQRVAQLDLRPDRDGASASTTCCVTTTPGSRPYRPFSARSTSCSWTCAA
jgi:hypothetical protein